MTQIIFAMLLFSLIHSVMAGQTIKSFIGQRFGTRAYYGLYRIGYNVIAAISLIPIFLLIVFQPGVSIVVG